MKKTVCTDKAPLAIGPYSQAVIAGNLMFVSGQIPVSPATGKVVEGGIEAQTKQALDNLAAILASQALLPRHVVKTTVFLANLEDFQAVNKIYGEYFPEEAPARACIQIARLPLDVLIEIEAVADLQA